MIVNNPDNAGLTPGPGISLAILSSNFSALMAVSFAVGRLVGAASESDGTGFEIGAATEVATLYATSEAASVAVRSAKGWFAREGVGSGIGVGFLKGCCWTRLGVDEEDRNPGDLSFPNLFKIEENFGGKNLGMMMIQNKGLNFATTRGYASDSSDMHCHTSTNSWPLTPRFRK